MKIKLTKDRKVLAIETDEFTLQFNGKPNRDYAAVLRPLGILLEFSNNDSEQEETTDDLDNSGNPIHVSSDTNE